MLKKIITSFILIGLSFTMITPLSANEDFYVDDINILKEDTNEITPYGRYGATLTAAAAFPSTIDGYQQIISFVFSASVDADTGYLYSATYSSHSSSIGSPAYTSVTKTSEQRINNTQIRFNYTVYEKILGVTYGTHKVSINVYSPGPI